MVAAADRSGARRKPGLGVSLGSVARHLGAVSNEAKAPIGSDSPNGAKAPTGSGDKPEQANRATAARVPTGSRSLCEPLREQILEMLDRGLSAQRIFQDLVAENGFQAEYSSVRRYVARLGNSAPLPFRRMEVAPGEEAQIDIGQGAPLVGADGRRRRTHVIRVVLSHSPRRRGR